MAIKGVDVSEMNGSVDFQALKAAGIQFVLIRCGYGSDYPFQDDACFAENVRKADTAGMPWGAYLYSYAKNADMAKSEAAHTLRVLNGRKPAYGVWYDVEDSQQAGCDLAVICDTYCRAMEAAGLYVGLYSFLSWLRGKLGSPVLDKYDKWVADWDTSCGYGKPYGIWQFTDNLVIGGKAFDGNYAYKDYPSLTKGGNPVSTKSRVFSSQENAITQGFGNGHGGVDLGWKTDPETPIIAHSGGTVVFCQTGYGNDQGSSGNASYGNCVKLRHPNGYFTLYAHLSGVKVSDGQQVEKGRQIGNMGNSGNSYGNHLHFEVRNTDDVRIDPAPYLAADLPGLNTEKEEPDLTEAEARKIAREEIGYANPTYHKVSEVPDYWRKDIQELMDKGVIRGGTAGDLELRHSDAKAAVLVKRALEAEDPIYRTIDDVPAWGRPYVQALIDRGTLEGEEAPVNGVRILNIRYSAVRLIKMLAEEPAPADAE